MASSTANPAGGGHRLRRCGDRRPVAHDTVARNHAARDAELAPSALKGWRVPRVSPSAPHHRPSCLEFLPQLACIAFGVAAATGSLGRVTPPPLPGMPRWISLGCIASACGAHGKAASAMPAPPPGRSRPSYLRSRQSSAGQLLSHSLRCRVSALAMSGAVRTPLRRLARGHR